MKIKWHVFPKLIHVQCTFEEDTWKYDLEPVKTGHFPVRIQFVRGQAKDLCWQKALTFQEESTSKILYFKGRRTFQENSTRTYLFSLRTLVRGSPTAMVVATLLRKSINCLYCLATFVKCWLRHFTTNLVNYIIGSSKENFLLQEFHIKKLKNDLKSISWDKLQH